MRNNWLNMIPTKKPYWIGLAILMGIVVYIGSVSLSPDYPSSKKLLRFNYILKNTSSELVSNTRFDVVLPMDIEGIQQILSVNAEDNYQINKRDTGEQWISFTVDQLAPFGSKLITFTAIIQVTDRPKKERIKKSLYLQEEKYIEKNAPVVKSLAAQLAADTHEQTVKNTYEWLVNNIIPSSYTADSHGAAYLLEKKTGDCTETMYAFIALARANGIPARGRGGFWIAQESSVINAADYHDWAEFYDGDQWILVDANKKVFSTAGHNYLALGLYNSPEGNRFMISNKNISVSFSQ